MSLSSSSLLAKLDELKKWQQHQQERLLKQHQARLEETNNRDYSEYDTIKGLSAFDSFQAEKTVVESPPVPKVANDPKPKRPFLRKGAGLVKFGMKAGDQKRPSNKMKPQKVSKKITPLKAPEVNVVPKVKWKEVYEEQESGGQNNNEIVVFGKEFRKSEESHESQGFGGQKLIKSQGFHMQSQEELTVKSQGFREDFGAKKQESPPSNSQDCSKGFGAQYPSESQDFTEDFGADQDLAKSDPNSEFLECFKQLAEEKFGAQNKKPPEAQHNDSPPQTPVKNSDNNFNTGPQPPNIINDELLRYLQQLAAKSEISVSSKVSDMSAYERQLEKELHVFEQLERKVMNSSFCSTSSSVLHLLSSTPQYKTHGGGPLPSDGKKVHFDEVPCKKALSFPQEAPDDSHSGSSHDEDTKVWEENSDCQDDGETTESTMSNCIVVRQNAATMTDEVGPRPASEIDEEHLRRKVEELNLELETFRAENKKLMKLKADVEAESRDLQKSRKKLEAEVLEERIRLEFETEEQRKKFNKEKMVFEKYVKDLQNKPNRKEREEISTLRCELESVRETLKLKETRNGTTQARLRNQIKALEKETGLLKDDLEKLQKQNAKLMAAQKAPARKSSESKMLHEINKNLTRLTEKKGGSVDDSLHGWPSKKKPRNRRKSEGYETEYQRSFGRQDEDSEEEEEWAPKKRVSKERQDEEDSEEEWSNEKSKSLTGNKRLSKDSLSKGDKRSSKESQSKVSTDKQSSKDSLSKDLTEDTRLSKDSLSKHSAGEKRLSNDSLSRVEKRLSKDSVSKLSSVSDDIRNLSEKENDKNSTNFDMTSFRNISDTTGFDNVFTESQAKNRNLTLNDTQATGGKVETFLEDGTKETKYPSGNVKRTSADGNFVSIRYFNGDLKETNLLDGSIKYFYAQNQIWQTTLIDGNEILEYPDGQIEKNFSDGRIEITFPNGVVKETDTEGSEKIIYPDGSIVTVNSDNEKVLLLPNGQKEIHTKEHKRREYPDGTVKILYPDGLQETRYSNGRIRMKDKDGNLLMDSHGEV